MSQMVHVLSTDWSIYSFTTHIVKYQENMRKSHIVSNHWSIGQSLWTIVISARPDVFSLQENSCKKRSFTHFRRLIYRVLLVENEGDKQANVNPQCPPNWWINKRYVTDMAIIPIIETLSPGARNECARMELWL